MSEMARFLSEVSIDPQEKRFILMFKERLYRNSHERLNQTSSESVVIRSYVRPLNIDVIVKSYRV